MAEATVRMPVTSADTVSDVLARDESLVDASATIVELDVREDLRSGREPFSKIMSAVAALGANDVLLLRTIFEPAPLFGVLAKRGFASESRA
ncbi:MAG TPA: DUF2249 domain-containing protein, partial [Gemmatimonadaceae bacterium]|nr:DUF2249 domain-containing protein [Gemmatimonadaceae bacterium]